MQFVNMSKKYNKDFEEKIREQSYFKKRREISISLISNLCNWSRCSFYQIWPFYFYFPLWNICLKCHSFWGAFLTTLHPTSDSRINCFYFCVPYDLQLLSCSHLTIFKHFLVVRISWGYTKKCYSPSLEIFILWEDKHIIKLIWLVLW